MLILSFLTFFLSLPAFADTPIEPDPEVVKLLHGKMKLDDFWATRTGTDKILTVGAAAEDFFHPTATEADCQVRPQGGPVVIKLPSQTQVWYVSDGSCLLPPDKAEVLKAAYVRMSDSLQDLKQYPKKSGGFDHLLEFLVYDSKTKKPATKITQSPFDAFIAVSGPKLLGLSAAATYYIQNNFAKKPMEGGEYFQLTFEGIAPPPGYTFPAVYSDTGIPYPQLKISRVYGSWYVDSKGYVRYFTAADFGLKVQYAADLASSILLDTLTQLAERAKPLK